MKDKNEEYGFQVNKKEYYTDENSNEKKMISPIKLQKLDQVVITMDNLNHIHNWFENFKEKVDVSKLVLFPFLEEGVFVLKDITSLNKKDTDAYLYFKYVEGEFEINLYLKNSDKYIPICGYMFKETGIYSLFNDHESIQIDIFHFDKQHDEDILMSNVTSTLVNFAAYMLFVDWINKNPEYVIKEKKEVNIGHPTKKNKNKKKNKTNINNKKTIYRLKTDTPIDKNFEDKIKKYNERVISWTVRGHFRRYKNGKVVWVKPHIKGKGELKEKDYTF